MPEKNSECKHASSHPIAEVWNLSLIVEDDQNVGKKKRGYGIGAAGEHKTGD